jgi:hypothetical protein
VLIFYFLNRLQPCGLTKECILFNDIEQIRYKTKVTLQQQAFSVILNVAKRAGKVPFKEAKDVVNCNSHMNDGYWSLFPVESEDETVH